MTSSLPPRRRDTSGIGDRLRQDRENLRQLNVGMVGGRFSPAKPLRPFIGVDEDDDTDDEETTISFWNTDRVVAAGPGTIRLNLTHVPIDGSLHIRWHGVDQPPTEWTMLGEQTVIIPDPHGHVEAGDVFSSAYAYESDGQTLDDVDFTFISATSIDTAGVFGTIAMPNGAQSGDLLIVTAAGGWNDGVTYFGHSNITDSRLSSVWTGALGSDNRYGAIAAGTLGSDLSPIQIDVTGPPGTGVGEFVSVIAFILRPSALISVDRVAVGAMASPFTVPALSASGSGSVAVVFALRGFGGISPSSVGAPYVSRFGNGTYVGASIFTMAQENIPAVAGSGAGPGYRPITLGLSYGET